RTSPHPSDDKNDRVFTKAVTVSEEDHFSSLLSDCVLHVFKFLDQVDLDVLSSVSQTIHSYVNLMRPKTARSQMINLLKLDQTVLQISLTLRRKDFNMDLVSMDFTADGRLMTPADHIHRQRVLEGIGLGMPSPWIESVPTWLHNFVMFPMQRFHIQKIELDNFGIFEAFADYFNDWCGTHPPHTLLIHGACGMEPMANKK
ncbi:hypothetical protein PENTCL1PPCAC_8019, partial [Pristionchus entomophagus]